MNTDQNDIEHQATVEGLTEFTCHKKVHSKKMPLDGYHDYYQSENDRRKMAVPQEDNLAQEGYLVVYEMGEDTEYRSWSPKKAFDDGYTVTPQTFKERLLIESLELEDKASKLSEFIHESEVFETLSSDARTLMIEQLEVMKSYSAIIGKRVSLLT